MVTVSDIRAVVFQRGDKSRITSSFLDLSHVEKIPYDDEKSLGDVIDSLKSRDYPSKSVIILREYQGRRFQVCPGTKVMICCNYRLLNTCFDCLYNCAYCYLNSYLNAYGIVQFTNLDDLADEIVDKLPAQNELVYRIGTGEFTDSLMMDEVTGIAHDLIGRLVSRRDIMLEFKTKSDHVDHLLDIPDKGNTVLAWSLNTPFNISRYEEGTATLDERIAAAERAVRAGYYIAFHFDPVIRYPGFLDEYYRVIDRIFSRIDHTRVVWISLGCFRHSPGFKEIIRERFPDERMTLEEMFPGPDGKSRYLMKERADVYCSMLKKIRSYSEYPFVYMCMETAAMWEKVFNLELASSDELELVFSRHLRRMFPGVGTPS